MDNLQTQIRFNPLHSRRTRTRRPSSSSSILSSSSQPSLQPLHRSSSSISSSSSSSSSPSPSIDQASDPLQRWFIFSSPSQTQTQTQPQPILDPHPSSASPDSSDHPFQLIPSSSSLHSHPHHHFISSPSMPTHDGRGRFLNSNDPSISSLPPSSSSSSSSHLDYSHLNHLSYSPSPLGSSIVSLSNSHSELDDDLLSIPSSLSITLSGSRRSSSHSDLNLSLSIHHRSSFQERISLTDDDDDDDDDNELMLTPMAISAGISTPHSSIAPSHPSSQSSHHSSAIGALAPSPNPDSRQPATTSSHRPPRGRSRIRPVATPRSSSSQRPPLIPSDRSTSHHHLGLNINHILSHHHHNPSLINLSRQASIKFLTNVATKLLDLDADTMKMLNASDLNPPYTTQSRLPHKISFEPVTKTHLQKIKNPRLAKFSIGDGDHRLSSSQLDDDTINSPLDISGFVQPKFPYSSSLKPASWELMDQTHGDSHQGQDDDDHQTEVEDDGEMRRTCRGRRRQIEPRCLDKSKLQPTRFRSRSSRGGHGDHHIESSRSRSSTRRSVSDSDLKLIDRDDEPDWESSGSESYHHPHPSNPSHSSSNSSIAGILLQRVLDEWTNW